MIVDKKIVSTSNCFERSGKLYLFFVMAMAADSTITNEAREEIKAVMQKGLDGSLSSFLPSLVQTLKKHQLAWSQRISSLLVGVHPSNRDGQGLSSSHVERLCSELAELGWCGELQKPLCAEITPGDSSVISFNQRFLAVLFQKTG